MNVSDPDLVRELFKCRCKYLMQNFENPRVVLTHHWMPTMRGGEKVLEQLCRLFPNAEIKCLIYDRSELSEVINRHQISASFLQLASFTRKNYKQLLPLHPLGFRSMRVPKDTELVICSDASMAKAIRVPNGCKLVCYCHSPPRYLWDMADDYVAHSDRMTPTRKLIFKAVIPFLRRFDRRAAQRVDKFIANSQFIADRIERCYGKPASVIYPPVSVDSFEANTQRKDFFLVVSELVPYKRIDLAVEAFNRLGLPLVVIGDGSERESLEGSAKSNIRFLGRQPFETLKLHYESCKAFVFPGVEDFGITPVEAQAAGAPVIAFDKGGAKETVRDRQTGLLFKEQSVDSLADAISSFEAMTSSGTGFSVSMLAENAERFSETCFQRAFRAELAQIQS